MGRERKVLEQGFSRVESQGQLKKRRIPLRYGTFPVIICRDRDSAFLPALLRSRRSSGKTTANSKPSSRDTNRIALRRTPSGKTILQRLSQRASTLSPVGLFLPRRNLRNVTNRSASLPSAFDWLDCEVLTFGGEVAFPYPEGHVHQAN